MFWLPCGCNFLNGQLNHSKALFLLETISVLFNYMAFHLEVLEAQKSLLGPVCRYELILCIYVENSRLHYQPDKESSSDAGNLSTIRPEVHINSPYYFRSRSVCLKVFIGGFLWFPLPKFSIKIPVSKKEKFKIQMGEISNSELRHIYFTESNREILVILMNSQITDNSEVLSILN